MYLASFVAVEYLSYNVYAMLQANLTDVTFSYENVSFMALNIKNVFTEINGTLFSNNASPEGLSIINVFPFDTNQIK